MIWTIAQFPELNHLEPDQRAALLAGIPRWTYPLLIVGSFIQGLLLGGLALAYSLLLTRSFKASGITAIAVALASSVALYHYRLSRVRADMRRTIAEACQGERTPFCFQCGYDLRASDATRCPECGRELPPPPPPRGPAS
jgi:hypothetical protein